MPLLDLSSVRSKAPCTEALSNQSLPARGRCTADTAVVEPGNLRGAVGCGGCRNGTVWVMCTPRSPRRAYTVFLPTMLWCTSCARRRCSGALCTYGAQPQPAANHWMGCYHILETNFSYLLMSCTKLIKLTKTAIACRVYHLPTKELKTAIACRVYHLPTKELNLARSGKSDPDDTFSM
eukprot:COSAG01_NODE_2268_length_8031_cov_70.657341_4_plen_179_part_00